MLFYPNNAPVPTELRTAEFVLEPLSVRHVAMDHAALMDSKEMLRRWSQSGWPSDSFTLEENYADLDEHEREHGERVAFTYTVLDPTKTTCLGCVYIKPMASFETADMQAAPEAGVYRGRVAFWARQPRIADDLDRRLLNALIAWFGREWAFDRVVFFTSALDERQQRILAEAGLQRQYTKTSKYQWVVFG